MKLTLSDRAKVIESLFEDATASAFADGLEGKILEGLVARSDEQLISFAKKKNTWLPPFVGLDTPSSSAQLVKMAMEAISCDWERCDEESGGECLGIECHIGAHKALAILQSIVP